MAKREAEIVRDAPPARSRAWTWHALIFTLETCVALYIGSAASCSPTAAPAVPPPDATLQSSAACCGYDVTWPPLDLTEEDELAAWDNARGWPSANASAPGRRLVANDFNADFSRRLTFHTWVEEDVALDRRGLERYLRRAMAAAKLPKSGTRRSSKGILKTVEALQRSYGEAGFAFDVSYAAQAHHMLAGMPWSHGRDEFMRLVRHGLRPNHYFLSLGCGPLATGHHVVRYLLTGRYHCIEPDEYLLRAAVEYEIPSKGLIHKRPRFLFDDLDRVNALVQKPPAWLPTPPSHFDFVLLETSLEYEQLEKAVTSVVRYLRPRSGRLVVAEPLPSRIQRQLGLQPSEQNNELLTGSDSKQACPFSLKCAMYAYNT
jgi:hypothetical protein